MPPWCTAAYRSWPDTATTVTGPGSRPAADQLVPPSLEHTRSPVAVTPHNWSSRGQSGRLAGGGLVVMAGDLAFGAAMNGIGGFVAVASVRCGFAVAVGAGGGVREG
jgi:hypothetical protein